MRVAFLKAHYEISIKSENIDEKYPSKRLTMAKFIFDVNAS